MKFLNYLLLTCVLIFTQNFLFANEIKEYHDKVAKAFADKDNLTMVLGAGNYEENYERLKDYTFLVNPEKETSLDALNAYLGSKNPGHKKIASLSDIDLSQTPLPLILDFNKQDFLDFLKKLPGKFSEIIFDYSVSKFFKESTLEWFKDIYKALNDEGVLIMDYESGTVSPAPNPMYLQQEFQKISQDVPDTKKIGNFDTLMHIPYLKAYWGGKLVLTLPNQTITYADVAKTGFTVSQKDFDHYKTTINTLEQEIINYNIAFIKKAGFERVEYHKDEIYPIQHKGKDFKDSFYKAYKKDPIKKLITSLEALKKSLAELALKLKAMVPKKKIMPTEVSSHNFDEEVLKSPLPVVVDMYATWCGPCKQMAPFFEELSLELSDKYKFTKLNIDKAPDITNYYGVSRYPTLLFFKNGKKVGDRVGGMGKEALRATIESWLGK